MFFNRIHCFYQLKIIYMISAKQFSCKYSINKVALQNFLMHFLIYFYEIYFWISQKFEFRVHFTFISHKTQKLSKEQRLLYFLVFHFKTALNTKKIKHSREATVNLASSSSKKTRYINYIRCFQYTFITKIAVATGAQILKNRSGPQDFASERRFFAP